MSAVPVDRARLRLQYINAFRNADDSWKRDGCGPRCQATFAQIHGRPYPERLVQHDAEHHEAYGLNVLASSLPTRLGGIVRTGCLTVNGHTCEVFVSGRPIRLTPIETAMLGLLASRCGSIVPYGDILRAVWGPTYVAEPGRVFFGKNSNHHLLRVHVSRLRGKLAEARGLLATAPALGYRLLNEPALEVAP